MQRTGTRILLVALALVFVRCGGGSNAPSRTEEARRNADPKAVEFLINAQGAYEAGYYNGALILTDSAARYAPELADIPFLRGRILTTMRQFEQARAAYEETLERDPAYPGVYFNLGNTAFLHGQAREALNFYRKEKSASGTAAYLTQLGRAYADLGEADSAQAAYEQAIAADTTLPTAYMWLGQLYEDAGSFDQALRYSRKGLALRPDNLNYAYVVGIQLLRSGDLEAAASLLKTVTDGLPFHYAAHYNLGQAYMGLGRETDGSRYLVRADSLLEQRREIDKWENLVNANSHEPMLWVNYGTALSQAGRVDDAIEALAIAFSLQPQWLELQNNIANLLILRGDTTAALKRYETLLEIDPTQADVWLNLGTIHALMGNYAEARTAWETALKHNPDHPEARTYLAQLPE